MLKEAAIRTEKGWGRSKEYVKEREMDEQRGREERGDSLRNRDRESGGKKRGGIIRVRGRGRHREGQKEKDSDKVEVKEYVSLLNLKFIQS